ncbi:Rho termination factor N-terminal domain-containing protein [Rhodopirellula europaea]|jgi:plasmid stabilization system protein ParE|uniref:Protein containing Rho termination factor n=1 Tax=Rhodopirellula europaea SH398 TaxID=1263868 RepID=M5SC36_9BACT|nr:Rho termination factor N-terminal domain-containing protein [Rhodopirellula europaea]EMI23694.1 protein containing Rho termination factor [Rhodopirellula europaea SH398]
MAEWTDKDRRQYEHIKDSELDRGHSEEEAEEIAARTVNKQRRKEERTPNQTTQGTGNPNTSLEDRTVDELHNLASELEIEGRSKMNKSDLIQAIRNKRS